VEVAPDHTPAPEPTPMLCPTVLVVDDEDSVLKMIQQALEASGYVVYSARTDDELLALWKRHKQEIDLLITDVMMPGMSGVEVAAHLRQDREDLTVLYISAYTDSVMLQFGGEHNEREFLPKPFTPDALLARVRDMLRPEPDTATV
jgi:DNA-binding response OmpR family regulator